MSIPTSMTQEPLTGDTIEAARVRDHAKQGTAKRYIEGLNPSLAGTTLTILASPAWGVYVGGNLWRRAATEANHVETLTDDAVNHVYFAPNGNIEVNTSGTPADAGSVKLYTITVTSGTPVLTSDDRTTIFDFPDGATFAGPVSAPGEKVSADNFEADGTDPELVFIEGVVKRKIRFTGTALQVLDESDAVLTPDLGSLGGDVESKTANFTAEAGFLYLASHATPATRIIATLPESPSAGDIVTIVGGANTAGFRVKENATSTEAIKFFTSTTAGTGSDYWQCDAPFQALRVVFDATQWIVSFHVGDFQNTAVDAEGDFVKADGSIPFTADQSFGSNKATSLADGTADSDGVNLGQLKARAPSYDDIDASTAPASSETISEGWVHVTDVLRDETGSVPGAFGSVIQATGVGKALGRWFGIGSGQNHPVGIPAGTKLLIKGHVKASAATLQDTDDEFFAVGVTQVGFNLVDSFGAQAETVRDDAATVAAVVDAADQSIQSYNTATNGNAAYTDSGFDANIVTGFEFQMELEVPDAADNANDLNVTIRVEDSGGTLRTILTSAAPAQSDQTAPSGWVPTFMVNATQCLITKLSYRVVKV